MSKTAVTQWDTTAANNTDVGGISIQGTAPVSNFDNAMREMMAQIAAFNTAATFTGTTTLGSAASITSTSAGTLLTLESSDVGATNGPGITLYRNSASPAASDVVGLLLWSGKDSAGNVQSYGDMYGLIVDPTSGSEDFSLNWETFIAGTNGLRMTLGAGLYMAGATGTDKGAGTINATGYYLNGTALPTAAYATAAQYRANTASLTLQTSAVWSAADTVVLTDAATIAVDMSTFINGTVTLAGNRTLGNPTNTKNGQAGLIYFLQDGTGSRTLAFSSNWKFAGGTDPVLSTPAGTVDVLFYQVINSTFIVANLVKAVA